MCCLLWRMYEMHPALSLKSGCGMYAGKTPHPFRAPTSGDGEKSSVAAIFLFLLASELPNYLFSPHHILIRLDGSDRLDGGREGEGRFQPLGATRQWPNTRVGVEPGRGG
jgi:hypothetical protein